jgi:hypothetical protein
MNATPAPAAPPSPGPSPAGRGPVTSRERSLAPDLARGTVLLFIALANVSTYLYGRTLEPGSRPVGGTALDNALDVLVNTVVDRRSYPMFALLFGYGMVQLLRRQAASGAPWPEARPGPECGATVPHRVRGGARPPAFQADILGSTAPSAWS